MVEPSLLRKAFVEAWNTHDHIEILRMAIFDLDAVDILAEWEGNYVKVRFKSKDMVRSMVNNTTKTLIALYDKFRLSIVYDEEIGEYVFSDADNV